MTNKELLNLRPIGKINDEDALKISKFLNGVLANEFALFTKTLNYHWNITGPRFSSMHEMLEVSYKDILLKMDSVAERIRVLGETPISTVENFNRANTMTEINGEKLSTNQMLFDLFKSNLQIQDDIKTFFSDNNSLLKVDPVSEDFLMGLLQSHEMMSWKLKSHID